MILYDILKWIAKGIARYAKEETRLQDLSGKSRKSKHRSIGDINYKSIAGTKVERDVIAQCSQLYSANYGLWGAGERKGKRIKLPVQKMTKIINHENVFVSLAYDRESLVGLAIYHRKYYEKFGFVVWVMHLVVSKKHRANGIAKKLLQSAWCFSDDMAWGLATANPITVKALEQSTYRKCNPLVIAKNIDLITAVKADIHFAKDSQIQVGKTKSVIKTDFFVDHKDVPDKKKEYGNNWRLGELSPGEEWLAFTFREQEMSISKAQLDDYLQYSRVSLDEIYSRMDLPNHGWARHAPHEVEYILAKCGTGEKMVVSDIGCGIGRHAIQFALKGHKVYGYDISSKFIEYAKRDAASKMLNNVEFVLADCRDIFQKQLSDLVVMLYDVVGSYPDESSNIDLLRSGYNALKPGGHLVISVMNMALTEHIAKHKYNLSKKPEKLFELTPSRTMQVSGEIFNPDYFILDTSSGLVFRKEQFLNDGLLSAEYIVRDKRYLLSEITLMLKEAGFEVVESKYVRAGNFRESLQATSSSAKEILLVARKPHLVESDSE